MTAVEYVLTDASALESLRPLWNQLNEYHIKRSRFFRTHYEQWTFDDRKAYFEGLARIGSIRVEIARDPALGWDVGYCVSSLSRENHGEIESVFVIEAYRNRSVGSTLVARALLWMEDLGAVRVRVSVANGNEPALEFYRKSGFRPRMTVLEIPPSQTGGSDS
jgi:ribosomal protein S18 acetylase RimI-like enzyme